MMQIKEIVQYINEQLDDAYCYAQKAQFYKPTDAQLSKAYASIAKQEITHADILHEQAMRMIRNYKQTQETPPAMQAIWDWQHAKVIDEKTKIMLALQGV